VTSDSHHGVTLKKGNESLYVHTQKHMYQRNQSLRSIDDVPTPKTAELLAARLANTPPIRKVND